LKTVILVHGDNDGVVSGALAYKFFTIKHENQPIEVFFSHPAGLHVDLREFAKPGDTIFIADIALSELHLEELMRLFKMYSDKGELMYIDHHPEPFTLSVASCSKLYFSVSATEGFITVSAEPPTGARLPSGTQRSPMNLLSCYPL